MAAQNRMRKPGRGWRLAALLLALLLLAGCGGGPAGSGAGQPDPSETPSTAQPSPAPAETAATPASTPAPEPTPTPDPTSEPTSTPSQAPTPTPALTPQPSASPGGVSGQRVVVLDPGHQNKAMTEKEPVGPGASEMKAMVSSGTQGRFTRVPEHQVNLEVALQLRDELVRRGYQVIMTRESGDVSLSNAQRAEIANEAGADAFVRIHCNGSEDPAVHGALTICPTKNNPYPVVELYQQCRSLSDAVLDGLVEATGAQRRKVWETDTMSGINWCRVPVTIVEMGYMTNEEEDHKLVSPEYQAKLVQGIANGLDSFFLGQTTP